MGRVKGGGQPPAVAAVAATAGLIPRRIRLLFYRLGPLTRGMRRLVNRAVPEGPQPVQVAAGELRGRWLVLDLQVDKDLWLGNYEPDVSRAIRDLAPAGSVAYDLGANLGYTALLLAEAVGPAGRVVAFEPLPQNVSRLKRAFELNGIESRLTVVAAAVGAESGRAAFRVQASDSMGRLEQGPERGDDLGGTIPVEVVAVDEYIYGKGNPAPLFVKMDLEGGEGGALAGMSRLLREKRPVLVIELHGLQAGEEVGRVLSAAGYRLHRLEAGRPSIEGGALPKHILALAAEASP
jgi:FkbM family methyltransferase